MFLIVYVRENPFGLSKGNRTATLQECALQGKSLLIENVGEELDPLLDSILNGSPFQDKPRNITIGDKEVRRMLLPSAHLRMTYTNPNINMRFNVLPQIELAAGFKMFLVTREAMPQFSPETSSKVTVVDFTVTDLGLEEQLLSILIMKEKV